MKISKLTLPKQLKIWGHDYRVSKQKDPKTFDGKDAISVLGYFQADDQRIVLKSNLSKYPSREVEVLIHEIFHAVCYNSNAFNMVEDRRKIEEHAVDTIANGFVLVLKDNPELIDYLKDRLHE